MEELNGSHRNEDGLNGTQTPQLLWIQERQGIGGVLRDWHGKIRCIFSINIKDSEINDAELKAIHMGCSLSRQKDLLRLLRMEIESDSKNAVMWCNNPKKSPWNLTFFINIINLMRSSWSDFRISHKGRDANVVADLMAKQEGGRVEPLIAWL